MQEGKCKAGRELGTAVAGELAAETGVLCQGCQLRYQRNRLEKGYPKTPHSLETVEYSGRYEGFMDRAAIEVRTKRPRSMKIARIARQRLEGLQGLERG